MRLPTALYLLGLVLGLPLAATASPMFSFSFDNISGDTAGPIAGTFSLPDSGCSPGPCAATEVTITSVGAVTLFDHQLPYVIDPAAGVWAVLRNDFILSGAALTLIDFLAVFTHENPRTILHPHSLWLQGASTSRFENALADAFRGGIGELEVVQSTGTLAIAAVPAPASMSLIGLGLLGMWMARRRKRQSGGMRGDQTGMRPS